MSLMMTDCTKLELIYQVHILLIENPTFGVLWKGKWLIIQLYPWDIKKKLKIDIYLQVYPFGEWEEISIKLITKLL